MIRSFTSKGLPELFETGNSSRIDARLHKRILIRLDRLDAASLPRDMNLPGFDFHSLRGFEPTRYTVNVNRPWCITFEFDGNDAVRVELEQYHRDGVGSGRNMDVFQPARPLERWPSHPGALLADIIPATGRSKVEIATARCLAPAALRHPAREETRITQRRGSTRKDVR